MAAGNYFEGGLHPEAERLELPPAGQTPTVCQGQLMVGIDFAGFILRGRGERSMRGKVAGHQRSLAQAAVLTQVDEQEQQHNEHDSKFHRGQSLWGNDFF
jgi:hypothetical protein